MTFLEFCRERVTGTPLDVKDVEIPDRYKKAVQSMVQMMKNKRNIFDSINVPFVENAFTYDYEEILKDKLEDGDVPDGIIHTLAIEIFGEQPIKLSKDQTAIIKILSTYICIQS